MSKLNDQMKGGMFVLKPSDYTSMFIPEQMDDEQSMVFQSTAVFHSKAVSPVLVWYRAKTSLAALTASFSPQLGRQYWLSGHGVRTVTLRQ